MARTSFKSIKKVIGLGAAMVVLSASFAGQAQAADFVTTDSGTGIVHIAPAFGEVDYGVLVAEQARFAPGAGPALLNAVGPDGCFTDAFAMGSGRFVKDCDRDITRDLDWGIPVKRGDQDWPGMEGKVFYVWFDAPIEYIACAQEWVDAGKGTDWERWWRTDKGADDVRYVQFMGKDNVPFHTLSFPATIIGSGEPWKLVDYIKSFNYLNYDGGQFSTSQGRGVFMDQALEILPADYWRWWLLSHVPEDHSTCALSGLFPELFERRELGARCFGNEKRKRTIDMFSDPARSRHRRCQDSRGIDINTHA